MLLSPSSKIRSYTGPRTQLGQATPECPCEIGTVVSSGTHEEFIAGCCARAATGRVAAAPPSREMKFAPPRWRFVHESRGAITSGYDFRKAQDVKVTGALILPS